MKTTITFEYHEDEPNTAYQKIHAENAFSALSDIKKILDDYKRYEQQHYDPILKDLIKDIEISLLQCRLEQFDIS